MEMNMIELLSNVIQLKSIILKVVENSTCVRRKNIQTETRHQKCCEKKMGDNAEANTKINGF